MPSTSNFWTLVYAMQHVHIKINILGKYILAFFLFCVVTTLSLVPLTMYKFYFIIFTLFFLVNHWTTSFMSWKLFYHFKSGHEMESSRVAQKQSKMKVFHENFHYKTDLIRHTFLPGNYSWLFLYIKDELAIMKEVFKVLFLNLYFKLCIT